MSIDTSYTRCEGYVTRNGIYICLAVAALLRLYLIMTHGSIVMDGVVYLGMARSIVEGEWGGAFNATVFNLFPVLIAGMYRFLSLFFSISLETAAMCVTGISGVILVGALYSITSMSIGPRAAVVAGVATALNPECAEFSCDVLRTAPYLMCTAVGIACFIRGVASSRPREWRAGWCLAAVAACVVAAMIRLEALAWLGVMGGSLFVVHVGKEREYQLQSRLRVVGVVAMTAVIIAMCAVGVVRVKTGQWHFARADKIFAPWSLGRVDTQVRDPLDISIPVRYNGKGVILPDVGVQRRFISMARSHQVALTIAEINAALWKAVHPVIVLLAIAGVVVSIRHAQHGVTSPLSCLSIMAMIVFTAVFARYVSTHYYLSTRHAMIYLVIAAPWAGIPVLYARSRVPVSVYITCGVAIVSVLLLAGKAVKPIRHDKLPMKECGAVLREYLPEDASIIGQGKLRPVGYYAQRHFITGDRYSPARVRAMITRHDNRYILVNMAKQGSSFIAHFTDIIFRVECPLPTTNGYVFSLYTRTQMEEDDE